MLPRPPPPPQAYPWGFATFFFLAGLFPTPGQVERSNPHPLAPDQPHIHFLGYIFFKAILFSVQ